MDISIYKSALTSLIIQLIIGLLSLYGLSIKLNDDQIILNQILLLETIVQFIEFSFYIWLVFNFSKIKVNVSLIRYLDWFITTPTMLFSIISFFIYQNVKPESLSLKNIFYDNINILTWIFGLNAFMLILGFLGEIKLIKKYLATILGFFGLIGAYYLIYTNFVGEKLINNYLFWFNFILWSLYGIAYMLSFKNKNIFYNILDVFAKNINGLLILAYILYVKYY
jgi:bacteriorhodopsin